MTLSRTTLAIDRELLERFDEWLQGRGYANRSEAVRDLLRAALVQQQWQEPQAQVVGVLSVIFDHDARDLAQEVTGIQHRDHHAVLCSQHVHLDHHRCLEVILLKGSASRLRRMADAIRTTKGVLAGDLTLLSQDV
ncbi:MAG: nickel-responsive transcriptional regulator NikR [Phycisphaerae bacterium]